LVALYAGWVNLRRRSGRAFDLDRSSIWHVFQWRRCSFSITRLVSGAHEIRTRADGRCGHVYTDTVSIFHFFFQRLVSKELETLH
jgi:hypothetical protein